MVVYVETILLSLEGLEVELLTTPSVHFVFQNVEILEGNKPLFEWIHNSPLKYKIRTSVHSYA